jgi:hypothetical protein
MSFGRLVLPAAAVMLVTLSGCGSARLIQSGPDGGVVAIPSNSNYWPMKYRDNAEKLMVQKCPNGYIIVKEEEVVVGQKTTTSEQTDRITPTGYKDNRDRTMTSSVTSTQAETEFRITFRANQPVASVAAPAPVASPILTPVPPPVTSTPGLPPRPVPVMP